MFKCFAVGAAASNALGGGWPSPTHRRTGRGSTALARTHRPLNQLVPICTALRCWAS